MGSALGSAITAGASHINTGITNIYNRKNVKDTNATNLQIAEEANEADYRKFLEANEFSHNEAQLAFDRSVEQWKRENEYNSPLEQMKRFEEAGLNPQLAFMAGNGNGASFSNSPSASSVSPPTSHVPELKAPYFEPFDIGQSFMNAIQGFAKAKKDSADAKKAGVETVFLDESLNDRLRALESEADFKEQQSYLQSMFGYRERSAQVQESINKTALYAAEAKLAEKRGQTEESQKLLNDALSELHKYQTKLQQKDIEHYEERLRADIGLKRAQAAQASAVAITEDSLREVRKNLLGEQYSTAKSDSIIKDIDARVEQQLEHDHWQYNDRINAMLSNRFARQIEGLDFKKAEELYPIAIKMMEQDMHKGDMKDWYYYVDKLFSALSSSAGAAAGAYMGSKVGSPKPKPVRGFTR